jgi:hypothetical protein
MIRKISENNFVICYDADGEVFEDGFKSHAEATERYNRLRPIDQMIVSCRPPKSNTDVEFLAGSENGRQFQGRPEQGDFYRRVAEKRGQNVKGKKYLSQLARYPGDPEAWVSSRGDVQKVLEERGWGSDGSVNVKNRPRGEAPKPVDVAEDILERETTRAALPGMKPKERADLRERVRKRLKPSYK